MRIGRRSGAIDSVAAGAGAHEHDAHAVGAPAVNGLQIAVIERVLPHHGDNAADNLLVGDGAVFGLVIGDAFGGVVVVFAAQTHDDVGDGLAEQLVFGLVALFQRLELRQAFAFQPRGLGAQAVGLLVIQRAHVSLGDGGCCAQHAFLAAPGARAVAGDERFVIAPDHEMIAERSFTRVRGVVVIVKAKIFLRRVGQQPRENLRGGQVGVQILRLARHAERVMVAANLHAFATTLAKVGDENGEQPAAAGRFGFERPEDGRHVRIRQRQFINDAGEFGLRMFADRGQRVDFGADDVLERHVGAGLDRFVHLHPGAFLDAFQFGGQFRAFGGSVT